MGDFIDVIERKDRELREMTELAHEALSEIERGLRRPLNADPSPEDWATWRKLANKFHRITQTPVKESK